MQGLVCTAWLVISGYMSGRSLNTVKGFGCFLGQETLPSLHSTGLFQQHNLSVDLHERNRLLLNCTKIYKYKLMRVVHMWKVCHFTCMMSLMGVDSMRGLNTFMDRESR